MNRFFTKSIGLLALVGALTAFSTSSAQAAFLVGQVNYTGDATKDGSEVDFADTNVESVTGDFAVLMAENDPIIHEDPMAYPGVSFTPLWTHSSGVTFNLTTSSIFAEDADTLVLKGTGVFTHPDFDDTAAVWNLTVNQLDGSGSFSASSAVPAVPEPASLVLVGLGLAGLAARRRRAQA